MPPGTVASWHGIAGTVDGRRLPARGTRRHPLSRCGAAPPAVRTGGPAPAGLWRWRSRHTHSDKGHAMDDPRRPVDPSVRRIPPGPMPRAEDDAVASAPRANESLLTDGEETFVLREERLVPRAEMRHVGDVEIRTVWTRCRGAWRSTSRMRKSRSSTCRSASMRANAARPGRRTASSPSRSTRSRRCGSTE